jgi:hypothetical protein
MKTAAECLIKADENDRFARDCPDGFERDAFLNTADGWRRTALLARQQETWAAANPDAD